MVIHIKISAVLIATALLGCKAIQPTAAAGTSAEGTSESTTPSTGSAKVGYITDPTFNNMKAFEVKYPSNWQFQGTLLQGDTCMSIPSPVYKVSSPDGLSKAEQMPGMAWRWGAGPVFDRQPKKDCMPINGPMSAQDFLKFFAGTLKVNYVGPEAVPAEINAKFQQASEDAKAQYAGRYAAGNMQPPRSSRELARAIVTFQQGSVMMKGRLHAMVDCMESNAPGQSHIEGRPPRIVPGPTSTLDHCNAIVTYVTAPESQFAAVIRNWDAQGNPLVHQPDWLQAWMQRSQDQANQIMRQTLDATHQAMRASAQNFQHDQQVRQDMHEQFLNTMQRGTDISMANTQRAMNARSTSTSDWVDYSLDRQTVMDTNTGVIYKTTNQVTVGGALQKVHGDGTPY